MNKYCRGYTWIKLGICFASKERGSSPLHSLIDRIQNNFNGLHMKIFDSAFSLSERTLSLRGQRMEVLSRNIANSDTPGFKAQDINFKSILKATEPNSSLKTTQVGHIQESVSNFQSDLVYTVPFNSSVDGNTVELSVEQAKYGRAAAQYQATLRFLESDMSGIRKALRGD